MRSAGSRIWFSDSSKLFWMKAGVFFFLCFVVGVVYSSFRVALRQPFRLDEVNEATIGLKLSQSGPEALLPGNKDKLDITHPLLYSFTQAGIQKIFGRDELPLRLYGVLLYLVCGGLVFAIASVLLPGPEDGARKFSLALTMLLYLLNPLLIQHSVVVNTDNSVLAAVLLLFFCAYLFFEAKGSKTSGAGRRLILTVLFATCLWAKELTPYFLLAGILLFRILAKDWRRFFSDLFWIGILGSFLFWSSWGMYCFFTGTPLLSFVRFTLIDKGGDLAASIGPTLEYCRVLLSVGFRWPLYWVSFPFFASLLLLILDRGGVIFKKRPLGLIDLVFICALALWFPFQFYRPGIDMMKYQYPAYPFFIVSIGWLFLKAFRGSGLGALVWPTGMFRFFSPGIVLFGLLVLAYFGIGDYLPYLFDPRYLDDNPFFLMKYYGPILLICLAAFFGSQKRYRWNHSVLALILCILPVNMALDMNQSKVKYATFEVWGGTYAESGFIETAEFLARQMPKGARISVRYDVADYIARHFRDDFININPHDLYPLLERGSARFCKDAASPLLFHVYDRVSADIANVDLDSPLGQIDEFFEYLPATGSFWISRRRPEADLASGQGEGDCI